MRMHELHPVTELINKKQKVHSKEAKQKALTWLATKFPNAFDNSVNIQPLKIGIMNDVLQYADEAFAAGISKSKLREAVVIFTRRIDYLITLKAKEMRVDLTGTPIAKVSELEAQNAALKIKNRIEKNIKNARKNMPERIKSTPKQVFNHDEGYASQYAKPLQERAKSFSSASNSSYSTQTTKTSEVVIKHKSQRQFDPNVVARLKEKLGLAVRQKETV